jgi:ATP-dependent DNA helicase RecQ
MAEPEHSIESRKDNVTFLPGARARVRRYGEGVVIETTTQAVTLEFANGVRRAFLPEFVEPAGRASKPQGRFQ